MDSTLGGRTPESLRDLAASAEPRVAAAAALAATLLAAAEGIRGGLRANGGTALSDEPEAAAAQADALDRLAGLRAAGEATASLALAAVRAREASDPLAELLASACRVWSADGATLLGDAARLAARAGIGADTRDLLRAAWLDLAMGDRDAEGRGTRELSVAIGGPAFLPQFRAWVGEMRRIAAERPGSGACTLGSAMELWLWVVARQQRSTAGRGVEVPASASPLIALRLAEALAWLLAARCQILETVPSAPGAEAAGDAALLADLCHVQAARAAGEVGRIAADLVHGYNRHPAWDAEGCAACYGEADLAELEQLIPGFESAAGAYDDVIALDGTHKPKAGPCVRFKGLDDFIRLRTKLDGCLTGSRLARQRAADALGQ